MVRKDIEQMTGYVPGEQPRGTKVVKLNTNENPYPASPKVGPAIAGAVDSLSRYPDATATAFRVRAAEVLSKDNPDITPDWILCGNGSDDILTIVTRAFVDQRKAVRFAMPSYSLYKTLAQIQGVVADVVDYESDWTLSDSFTTDSEDVCLSYLANPNSPSGTLLSPDQVAQLSEAINWPLLVDEAYGDFATTNCMQLISQDERIMVSRTLSKSYGLAGLRFGYLVAQPQVIEQLHKVRDSYNCDALSIAAATAAIDDQDWLEENLTKVKRERDRLDAGLQSVGFDTIPSEANFVWCTHPSGDHQAIYEKLKAAGILVRHMTYQWQGQPFEGLRVSVGTPSQTDALFATLS